LPEAGQVETLDLPEAGQVEPLDLPLADEGELSCPRLEDKVETINLLTLKTEPSRILRDDPRTDLDIFCGFGLDLNSEGQDNEAGDMKDDRDQGGRELVGNSNREIGRGRETAHTLERKPSRGISHSQVILFQ